jgi:hypothetical protein
MLGNPSVQSLPTKIRIDAGKQSLEDMMRLLTPYMPKPDAKYKDQSSQWRLPEDRASEKVNSLAVNINVY